MSEGFFEFRQRMVQRTKAPAAMSVGAPAAGDALTVSQLTRQIERALKENLPATVLVRGEVSNFNAHAGSGHLYFTLKDNDACIDCVTFRSDAARIKFEPADGMELLATGRVAVYAQRGRYQLYVSRLEPLGQGALELAFRQLRAKLDGEGLFAAERKKPLPAYPQRIAIVTGAQAAALHDVLKVLRRFPWIHVSICPVAVQGDGAAAQIAAALRDLNRRRAPSGVEVIVLARGGGSLEDLWAFNEERVARAIADSALPIVTGIGHEVDVSIADLVADYHAHTPTEAAQVVTSNWRGIDQVLDEARLRLNRLARERLSRDRAQLESIVRHEFFRRPLDGVNALRQLLDDRQRQLAAATHARLRELRGELDEVDHSLRRHTPARLVARLRQRLIDAQEGLHFAGLRRLRMARETLGRAQTALATRHPRHALRLVEQRLTALGERLRCSAAADQQRRRSRVEALERELRAVSPQAVLRRGFSMTTLKNGTVVRSVRQIRDGERLTTRVADGTFHSIAEDPQQPKLFE